MLQNFGNLEAAKVQHQGFKLILFQRMGGCSQKKTCKMWRVSRVRDIGEMESDEAHLQKFNKYRLISGGDNWAKKHEN